MGGHHTHLIGTYTMHIIRICLNHFTDIADIAHGRRSWSSWSGFGRTTFWQIHYSIDCKPLYGSLQSMIIEICAHAVTDSVLL